MVDLPTTTGTAETPDDFGEGDPGLWAYWNTQEKIAEKEERPWARRSRKIVRRYRDERPDSQSAAAAEAKKFSLLWSNVETLLPVLYARTPKADVQRRYKDQDPIGRLASEILERAINYSIDAYDFDGVMKPVVKDRLLPGRGVARIIYEPKFGDEIPQGDEEEEAGEAGETNAAVVANEGDKGKPDEPQDEPLREVVDEAVFGQYVYWEDYREGPARVWAEVPWVRYRSYLTRDELTNRFGKQKAQKVSLDYTPKADEDKSHDAATADAYKKAIVHETWDKRKLETVWWCPGTPDLILDRRDDPLRLNGFFPNPDPLLATTTTNKRIPVPDYAQYQDQAASIDRLTQRIWKLIRALRAKGIYAADEKDSLQRLFDPEDDAILIPVENWAHLAAKGGLSKAIEWVPIDQIAGVLVQMYAAREKEIEVVYQLTGLSDILRGETQPTETLGAQQLKSTFATRRISPKQKDVAQFARQMVKLHADIIATHFSGKTISRMVGLPVLQPVPPLPPMPQQQLMPPPPQPQGPPQGEPGTNVVPHPAMGQPQQPPPPDPAMMAWQQALQQQQQVMQANQQAQQAFDQAVALLKQDAVRDFRIDIEADSTIAPDEMAEKAARTEFLRQFVPLIEQVIPMVQGNPVMSDFAKEIVLFAVRAFPAARSLEETIEKLFEELKTMPPNQGGAQQKGKAGQDPRVALAAIQQKEQEAQQSNAIKSEEVQGKLALGQVREQQRARYEDGRLAMQGAELHAEQERSVIEALQTAARDAKSGGMV